MEIIEGEVRFNNTDGTITNAFVAHPAVEGRYPGIVLVHEIWGLNQQIRGVARRYAREGFSVLAPHFFSRHGDALSEANIHSAMGPLFRLPPEKRRDHDSLQDMMKGMKPEQREVVRILYMEREGLVRQMSEDVKSCYDYFCSQPWVNTNKLGVTGFCMGGGIAFQSATQFPFRASVIFYGANPTPVDAVASLSGPVLAIYAGEDAMVNAGIPAIAKAMVDHKKTFALKVYAGKMHGFFNETSSLHDPDAAADAWRLAVAHFNKYLKE